MYIHIFPYIICYNQCCDYHIIFNGSGSSFLNSGSGYNLNIFEAKNLSKNMRYFSFKKFPFKFDTICRSKVIFCYNIIFQFYTEFLTTKKVSYQKKSRIFRDFDQYFSLSESGYPDPGGQNVPGSPDPGPHHWLYPDRPAIISSSANTLIS